MALTGDTGNGATLTLAIFNGTTAITASLDVISIAPGAITVAPVNVSTLDTEGIEENIPGDLATVAESSATFKWLTSATVPTLPSAAGTCTITSPLRSGEVTPATMTGTGFITMLQAPSYENGVLQVGSIGWQWDGETGPSFTVSAAS